DLHTEKRLEGNNEIIAEAPLYRLPLYAKGGAVIPMQRSVQSTAENPGSTLFLHVFNGNTVNSFTYYEDDGETYAYENGNNYSRLIRFDPQRREIVLEAAEGNFSSKFSEVELILHGFADGTKLWLDGKNLKLTSHLTDLFNALEPGDPQYLESPHKPLPTIKAGFSLKNSRIVIGWE
ncbi:MAG TPA: DUF5110 domain-containing protein, partial [Lentimicrobium sp.]|nr:DUF5110 domain-containing protein [Lentimicrobium sp.]